MILEREEGKGKRAASRTAGVCAYYKLPEEGRSCSREGGQGEAFIIGTEPRSLPCFDVCLNSGRISLNQR